MHYQRLNRSSTLPVTDEMISDHLRIFPESEIELFRHVQQLLNSACLEIEDHAEIALITQRIRVAVSGPHVEGATYRLPIGPAQDDATVLVSAVETDGTVTSLNAQQFHFGSGRRPLLHLIEGKDLPSTLLRDTTRLRVEYDAGFGSDHSNVPADLQLAVLDQAALYLDNGYDVKRGHAGLSPHTARIATRYRGVRI